MPTYDELRAAADAVWAAVEKPARPLFVVSMNTSSIAAGARETFDALRKLADTGAGFDVMQTGDAGLAWAEPVVEVRKPDGQHILYGHVTADKAEAFAKAAATGIAKDHADRRHLRRRRRRADARRPRLGEGAGPLADVQLRRHRPRQHRPLHRARRLLRTTWLHRRWIAMR